MDHHEDAGVDIASANIRSSLNIAALSGLASAAMSLGNFAGQV